MDNCRKLALRVLVSFAVANLVLPFSLVFPCFGRDRNPTTDRVWPAEKSGYAKVSAGSAQSQTDIHRATVGKRPGRKEACVLLQRSAIGLKHRLFLGRPADIRKKYESYRPSPLADLTATVRVGRTLFAPESLCRVDRAGSALDRCVSLSRLML